MNPAVNPLLLPLLSLVAALDVADWPPLDTPMYVDRPAIAGPETVGRGRFQIEGGVVFESGEGGGTYRLGELGLRLGLTEGLELHLGGASLRLESGTDELENLRLGLKWRLAAGRGARPALALVAEGALPTGSGASRERRGSSLALALGWSRKGRGELRLSLGRARLGSGDRAWQTRAGLLLNRALGERWGVLATARWAGADGEGFPERRELAAGLTFHWAPDIRFDLRAGAGLGGRDPDLLIGFGTALRF